jgi:hypothetical protein
MDQRSIVLNLARKGLQAMKIYNDLGATPACDAMSYSPVTRFLCESKFPSPNPSTTFSEDNRSLDDPNEAILLALTEQPFTSGRKLS